MELGRNIIEDNQKFRYVIVVRYNFEDALRRWHFDTHRKAMRKFNQLRKQADYLPIEEDITL